MSDELLPVPIGPKALLDADLLSLKEVAERSGWDYERLRSYLRDAPMLNDHVQAQKKKGSKGLGYPPDCIPFFEKMLADVKANKVVPTTLAGWLADLSTEPIGPSVLSTHQEAIGLSDSLAVQILQRLADVMERNSDMLQRHENALRGLPAPSPLPEPPPDELLSMKTAHERYGLSMKTLKTLRVKDGKVLKVRRSDCLRLIQRLSAHSTD